VRRPVLAAVALAVATLLLVMPANASARDCPAEVKAPYAFAMEASTGEVACERGADARRPVGSTVKLMTALVTLERTDMDDVLRASDYRPAPAESRIGLMPGERMTVRDLLSGLLVASGNDAAMTLAEGVAGSERAFVRLMNRRARELGLENTRYANPIGLDEAGAYSSARDLTTLALYLRRTRPFFRRIVDQPRVTLTTGAQTRTLANRNTLIAGTDWVNGVKTGYTQQAGDVLVGSGRRRKVQVVSAVLDEPSKTTRNTDTLLLLDFGTRSFQRVAAAPAGTHVGVWVPIRYRPGAQLELVVGRNGQRTVIPRGQRERLTVRPAEWPKEVQGPVAEGQQLGRADVLRDGERIGSVPLVAAGAVPEADLAQRTKSWFTRPLAVVLAFAVLGGTVLLARRRRRPRGPGTRRSRDKAGVA
jgi:serine-type D-Ala-D-Ala carboxypeptidase (penicillin-binding protein 5/6)